MAVAVVVVVVVVVVVALVVVANALVIRCILSRQSTLSLAILIEPPATQAVVTTTFDTIVLMRHFLISRARYLDHLQQSVFIIYPDHTFLDEYLSWRKCFTSMS